MSQVQGNRLYTEDGLPVTPANPLPVLVSEVDDLGYLVGIDIEHHKIHEGRSFVAYIIDTTVNSGEANAKEIHILTPNTAARFHIFGVLQATNSGIVEIRENPTITVNGSAVVKGNRDRNSVIVSVLEIYEDPTVTVDGLLISGGLVGANDVGNKGIGGIDRTDAEFILKQNEQYLIRFIADNDNTKIVIRLNWYEIPA